MIPWTGTSWVECGRSPETRQCRRNLRCMQAVPHLRVSSQKCSAVNSGAVNRRFINDAVAAGRAMCVGLRHSHALKSTELRSMCPGVFSNFHKACTVHTYNSTCQHIAYAIKSQSSHKSAEAWRQGISVVSSLLQGVSGIGCRLTRQCV